VSRWVVTGVFLALAAATAATAVGAGGVAATEPSARSFAGAAYAILKTAVVASFSVFVFTRGPSRRPSRDPLAFAACAAAIVAIVVLQGPPESAATPLVIAGDLLTVVSCGWLLVSVLTLGRCFGVLPEVRGLVTRGPYRLVRHPVYLGELGACAGLVLAAPTAWNFGAAAAFAAAQWLRMGLEEQALAAEFPAYADYAARTPRIIPRLLVRRPHELASGEHP
jgi:protein-S-isoprenylcysteine O-methyltransferase Ste14